MEHCPLCGNDTACTNAVFGHPPIYRCIECWIEWNPGRYYHWRRMERFNERDLILKGLLSA